MTEIHIVLASDQNYVTPLIVTITSILENNISNSFFYFHIINNNIEKNSLSEVQKLQNKYKCKILFYTFDINKIKDYSFYGHLTNTAYLRLFVHEILPDNIKKLLYIDCDIVCLKDISILYNENINDFPLGAVTDVKSKDLIRLKEFSAIKKYFNSGVMLINFPIWKKCINTNVINKIVRKQNNIILDADQEILNKLFINNWKELPSIFNFDSKHKIFKKIPKETVLLHYSDKIKPWHHLYPYKNKKYFIKYLKLSKQSLEIKNISFLNIKKQKIYFINLIKNIIRPIIPKNF